MWLLSDLKRRLGVALGDATADDALKAMEAAAVAFLSEATNRYWGPPVEFGEYLPGLWLGELYLSRTPIATGDPPMVRVEVTETYPAGGGVATVLAPEDFTVRGSRLVRSGGLYWSRAAEYGVTYTAGFAPGTEPADVREAVFELVRWLWKTRNVSGAYQSETFDDYSYTLASPQAGADMLAALPFVQRTIHRWKRQLVA